MSQLTNKGKLITRFEISFDNETKADIDTLKAKIDELTRALSVKNDSHGDRLLAAMQAEAANDAPQSELKQLGQWVFEGQPKEFVTAHVNSYGKAAISSMQISDIEPSDDAWAVKEDAQVRIPTCLFRALKGKFNATNWQNSAIARDTINDVEYLSGGDTSLYDSLKKASKNVKRWPKWKQNSLRSSIDESVPHIDDVLDQPNWLSESVPQITQADMQLIFIKNLSECLIQRMHSMNRFSEDDYAIGGDDLMAWDILIYEPLDAYAVLMRGPDQINVADLLLIRDGGPMADAGWNTKSEAFAILRTITEAELPAFRAALEACYA